MAEVMIRPMEYGDLASVLSIERENFSDAWTENQFRHDIERGDSAAFSAIADGRVVGYVCVWRVFEELHLTNISVDREFQGHGIGQRLLDLITILAEENGCTLITLEVRDGNTGAIRLYEKNRFIQVGRRKNYYPLEKADALIMNRNIGGDI